MGRRLRPHLPGATFHLTSRLHAGLPRFTPGMRTRAVGILREEVDRSNVDMLAYVIMPNHFHLVLRQGEAPLHRFMQPWLTRIALLVQRTWGCVGHVFERRYRDSLCDLDHLRYAIDYAGGGYPVLPGISAALRANARASPAAAGSCPLVAVTPPPIAVSSSP